MFTLMTIVCTLNSCEPVFFIQHVKQDVCQVLKNTIQTEILFKGDGTKADFRKYKWACVEEV